MIPIAKTPMDEKEIENVTEVLKSGMPGKIISVLYNLYK